MTASTITDIPDLSLPFRSGDAARVWNYWFSHRDLSRSAHAVHNPFADDYKLNQRLWFHAGPELDAELRTLFEPLVQQAARGELDGWRDTPRECLALVLLLDQLPRNMYRGTAAAFAHDARALALAHEALERGFHRHLSPAESLFFFLALTHSEHLPDVRRALEGITELGTRCSRSQQRTARGWCVGTQKHIDVLERFGRYPHRNQALGRTSTPEEEAFLARPEFTALFMRSQQPRTQPEAASAQPCAEQARAAPGPRRPKLKILALHGFRQNGEVFRARTRKLRHALEDIAEFTFVTSPHVYSPQGETRAATLAAFGTIPEYPTQRVWWMSSEDNSVYEGFDASVAYLETVFREQGPFDGVVGFAQGGTLAAVLAAMQPHPTLSIRFAICISAFPSRARAHAKYVQPRSIQVPALHVVGTRDILVTPDRSLQLFETFDPSAATLLKHPGGHFVPSAWPYPDIHAFVERFVRHDTVPVETPSVAASPSVSEPEPEPDDGGPLLGHAREALAAASRSPRSPIDVPLVQNLLHEMATQGRWRELRQLAVHAHELRREEDEAHPETSDLVVVHEEIVELFARQLTADLAVAANILRTRPGAGPSEREAQWLRLFESHGVLQANGATGSGHWPSLCAREAPRVNNHADKRCRLAKDIAAEMFRQEAMLAFIDQVERERLARGDASVPPSRVEDNPARRRRLQPYDQETFARRLSYQRYRQVLSLIAEVLATMDPGRTREQLHELRSSREYSPQHIIAGRTLPLSQAVIEPEPEPVVPCSLVELGPLLTHLRENLGVHQQTAFSKGTLTTDGRLDLCKQVVGPGGIRPLLEAMRSTRHVKRLLLGNNIVGDGGAAAIAEFLREREDSPLDCWYIAGNHIGPEGISHVCDALMEDTKVTSLWLKRNPLKAAGMRPLAELLRRNRTLAVLDLVNCGLLDEGLEVLLGALMGPGANKTLKHLYLGTNGITAASAPLIARFLREDCALESFYLSCNRLGDEGVALIAEGLAANRSITRVSLASNRVGPQGATALAEALAGHPSIALLDLGFTKATAAVGELGNFIGDEGARALARMLKGNTTLRSLDLLHNFISQLGVNHLRDALTVNSTLVTLQLTQFGRVHNEPGKEEIRAALERNRQRIPLDQREHVAKLDLPDHIKEIYSVYRTHS
ncbi:DUF924 family protein [Pyxidicoccus fallax]|uniref:DUF924 family protein n=1 Tax=Pyxidicoccus fallax TaxID=394095 RepID=A0A848LFF4_9BACT|nr:DUF924 family protein [Pyxidicoccus fallax]NMO15655.1 DUF924 family protein [Pyxidicoccus fallax]NPC80654.1 DUF924 family protein [Pyxidicoccus fallax]